MVLGALPRLAETRLPHPSHRSHQLHQLRQPLPNTPGASHTLEVLEHGLPSGVTMRWFLRQTGRLGVDSEETTDYFGVCALDFMILWASRPLAEPCQCLALISTLTDAGEPRTR